MKPQFWTLEKCKQEALKYTTLTEWQQVGAKNYGSNSYYAAKKYGWIQECMHKGMQKHPVKWTEETCFEDSLQYSTAIEWATKSKGAYEAALKNKWNICWEFFIQYNYKNKRKSVVRTLNEKKELCKADALQYKTKSEWRSKSPYWCAIARRNKIMDHCCEHMIPLNKSWDYDSVVIEAARYRTNGEWKRYSNGSYMANKRNNWGIKAGKQ